MGIRSDHEATTAEEGRARAALGLLVQVREGSVARNLNALLPLLVAGELGDDWCLVTDDVLPDELQQQGHLEGLLRRVVAGGVPPAGAVRHATLVPARHYGLTCPVIRVVPDQIVTRREAQPVRRVGRCWAFDPDRDLVLIASLERHRASGRIGLGLVTGLGLRAGALGSSVAHDSHNLIVAGTEARGMLTCVRALNGAEAVCHQLQEVTRAARALGCGLAAPFGTLSFLALPVIPEIRITTRGLFDVLDQRFISP